MFRRVILMIAFAALALPLAARKRPMGAPLVRLPDKVLELTVFWLPTPAQKCANWAWAVAVEAMLKSQQVTIKQNAWVQKANYGEVCIDAAPTLEQLAKVIDGAYVLDDGRHVRLQSVYFAGAPTIPDDLIAPLRQGRPVLLYWKSRALVVRAVKYDEYVYPNGQRMFEITEMRLVDALLTGAERELTFVNGRDDPADIGGVFHVVVIEDKRQPWQR